MCKFKVGDVVKVVAAEDGLGWGSIKKGDRGTVALVRFSSEYGTIIEVNFRRQSHWKGTERCFVLAEVVDVKTISKEKGDEKMEKVREKIEQYMSNELRFEYMNKVLKNVGKAKASINEILGLNADNEYRVVLDPPVAEEDWIDASTDNYFIREAVVRCFAHTELQCCTNSITIGGQTQKLTRVILKDLAKWKMTHPFRDFLKERFPHWEESQYGPRLGEIFVSNNKKVVVLSTNFFDFLSSSGRYWNLASFSSCHNWEGCYFNGNFSYGNDEMTLLAYVAPKDNLDYKEGRSWVYIPDGLDCIAQPKSYGSFNDVQRKFVREYIEKALNKHHEWEEPQWKARNVDGWYRTSGSTAAYFDSGQIRFAYPANIRPDYKDSYPTLNFAKATCPECGCNHYDKEHGVCCDCSGEGGGYCTACDERVHEYDGRYSEGGEFYCAYCYNERFTSCYECGDELWIDDATYVHDNPYCDHHVERLFHWCADCNEYYPKHECVKFKGEWLCEDCSDSRDIVKCADCGEACEMGDSTIIKDTDEVVCSDCRDNWYECSCCGEVFSEWHDDDREMCQKCAEDNPVEVEEDEEEEIDYAPSNYYESSPVALAA